MRYQKTSERRAVILMVVLSLLTLFALVGVSFVLYADAEAAAARVAREAQTAQTADVNPESALSFFLNQLIYDVPDTATGVGSSLRGHSLARTMYGLNYTVPPGSSVNLIPFNGVGRLHYGALSTLLTYPAATPLTNVPANFGTLVDDYALVNYSWFLPNPVNPADPLVRDPERYGVRGYFSQVASNPPVQPNAYVGGNAPYTYPDLNNFFLAAMRADGTVLTPSYHRPWLFQVVNGKFYAFNDMTNPYWGVSVPPTDPAYKAGKYLTLRPRPAEHPAFPLPGDATGDVKNLPWAPGGNDSIWVDLGAPVMTAPDGTKYKMMFAPLIVDLDGRVNLNTAGNMQAYIAAMTASAAASVTSNTAAWLAASGAHVSNQGWGPWEVNLSKVLWGDQALAPYPQTTPPTPPEWSRLFTGMSYAMTQMPPNTIPFTVQPGVMPPTPLSAGLSAWLLPGVRGRYLETLPGGVPLWTPNAAGLTYLNGAPGVNGTYAHAYAQEDFNALNELVNVAASGRPLLPGAPANPAWSDPAANAATSLFASFQQGFGNGNGPAAEGVNHPLLYNAFQSPLTNSLLTRTFRASDMEALLRPSVSVNGPVDGNASTTDSDLMRLCPANFPAGSSLAGLPANLKALALRYRNLVTTQSWDVGAPGVTPYWWSGMTTGYSGYLPTATSYQSAPYGAQPSQTVAGVTFNGIPPLPPTAASGNLPGANPVFSEFGNLPVTGQPDWRALSANPFSYYPTTIATTNPLGAPYVPPGNPGYVTPGARIRLNRPLPPYPHMGALVTPPYNSLPPTTASPYGTAYNLTVGNIANQYAAAQNARQALATDIYRRLLAVAGLLPPANAAAPTNAELAPRRWLAQLAVNFVDYIDEDDIMTPFNFYSAADINPTNPAAVTLAQIGTTQGNDDNILGTINANNNYATGANPAYWVFGTELPKVVLNEAVAQAQNPDPTKSVASDSVKIWVELFNTMTAGAAAGANTQPQDGYRVPLYISSGATGWSPYIITIAQSTAVPDQTLMPNLQTNGATSGALLPDNSCNVLGKANNLGYQNPTTWTNPPPAGYGLPWSTTIQEFATAANVQQMGGGAQLANGNSPAVTVGIDPTGATTSTSAALSPYFLIGPASSTPATAPYVNSPYLEAFAPFNMGVGVPNNTPVLRTPSLAYNPTWWSTARATDERTTGLSLVLRRLANPYLPLQPNPSLANYNPYVTVDYMANVPIQSQQAIVKGNTENYSTRGKNQPFSGLTLFKTGATSAADANLQLTNPIYGANTQNPPGSSPVALQYGANAYQASNGSGSYVLNTFGKVNYPMPDSGHYDWLVHLDRPPISPMELLHVSAWPPYLLTQRFVTNTNAANPGSDNMSTPASATTTTPSLANALNMFGHYAPWFDAPPPGITAANLYTTSCPWWFDSTLTAGTGSSHRLYRLFEFLECGDRALGVNGLGRIPGKVNINTIWDPEILQALIDTNTSMGTATNLPFPPLAYAPVNVNPATPLLNGLPWSPAPADLVSQVFANMMNSRSPNYYGNGAYVAAGTQVNVSGRPPIGPVNMGTSIAGGGFDDRPFMPLSMGTYIPTTGGAGVLVPSQFPNGFSVTTDTILRTNNPPETGASTNTYPQPIPPPATPTPAPNLSLLFQNYNDLAGGGVTTSAVHPYLQTQLLTKLYNNITTRSNTFAVFLTVGYFQVMTDAAGNVLPANGQANIPQLGPEVGRTEGKQIRHRMFAIVDRTNLTTFTTTGQAVVPGPGMVTGPTPSAINLAGSFNPTGLQTIQIPSPVPPPNATVTGTATQLFVANPLTGFPGVIQAGTQLVIDPGQINEETVTVISVTPPLAFGLPAHFTANFTLPHGVGNTPFIITQRGNPGPWVLTPYDPRLDTNVVQYFSIID